MNSERIFYCKARNHPVYYKVNPKIGIIESIKNWSEYAKAIDRFNYSAVFANTLRESYEEISADRYEYMREYVAAIITRRQAQIQQKNQPSETDNQIEGTDMK